MKVEWSLGALTLGDFLNIDRVLKKQDVEALLALVVSRSVKPALTKENCLALDMAEFMDVVNQMSLSLSRLPAFGASDSLQDLLKDVDLGGMTT